MQLTTVIVTRNVSISVKTLHTLLKLNIVCLQKNIANELVFVRDDPFEKYDILMKKLKHCDRILWIDYSLFVDEASILKMLGDFPKGCEVFIENENGTLLKAPPPQVPRDGCTVCHRRYQLGHVQEESP